MTHDTSMVSPASGIRFSIRLQVMAALGFIMLLVLLLAFSTLRGLTQIQAAAYQAIAVDTHLSVLANQVGINTLETRRYEKDLFISIGNSDELLRYKTAWEEADRNLGLAIEHFAQAATTEADKQQAALWRNQKADYDAGMAQLLVGLTNGTVKSSAAANAAFTPFKDGIRALTDTAIAVSEGKSALARSSETTLLDVNNSTRNQAWIIAVVAILLGIAWSLFFPAHLIRPIVALQKATRRLAAGDLDARLDINRRDELGLLANSFNQMVASLRAGKDSEVRAREVEIERELRRARRGRKRRRALRCGNAAGDNARGRYRRDRVCSLWDSRDGDSERHRPRPGRAGRDHRSARPDRALPRARSSPLTAAPRSRM